jgi:hypothetical protein
MDLSHIKMKRDSIEDTVGDVVMFHLITREVVVGVVQSYNTDTGEIWIQNQSMLQGRNGPNGMPEFGLVPFGFTENDIPLNKALVVTWYLADEETAKGFHQATTNIALI